MTEREALQALVSAVNFRSAALVSGALDKLDFAHQRMWEAMDKANEVLARPQQKKEE